MEYLYDSAYFNLKMRFIILKTKVLQTKIAKLGRFLLAFVLGRRIVSGSERMSWIWLENNRKKTFDLSFFCNFALMKTMRGILSVFVLLVVFSLYDFGSDLAGLKLFSVSEENGSVMVPHQEGTIMNFETPCQLPHQISNSFSFTLPVRDLRPSQRTSQSFQTKPQSSNGASPEDNGKVKTIFCSTSFGKVNFPAPYHFSDNALYAIRKLRL